MRLPRNLRPNKLPPNNLPLNNWKASARRLLGFVFPSRCVGCEAYLRRDALACERCDHAIFAVEGPQCLVCGQPRQSGEAGCTGVAGYAGVDEICRQCLERRPHFDRARARWEYSGTIAEALQRAKYRGQLWALRSLAARLHPWLIDQIDRHDADPAPVICTVPMHLHDLRRRGFNAALLLARLALPDRRIVEDLVIKTKKTPAQAGLARGPRLVNLRGAFECRQPHQVAHKKVIVFDDVMTTGATTSEVARVLGAAGASEVVVVTAARAVRY